MTAGGGGWTPVGRSSTTKPPTGVCAPGHTAILWTPGVSGGDTQVHTSTRQRGTRGSCGLPHRQAAGFRTRAPSSPTMRRPLQHQPQPTAHSSLHTLLSCTHPRKLLPNAWYQVPVSAMNMTGKRALPRTRQLPGGLGKSPILTRMEVKFATCLHGEPKPRMFASDSLHTHALHPGPASEDSPTGPPPSVHHHPGSGHDCLAAPREFRGPRSALP